MYIELHAASAFSFLQGASLPETLVERAAALGYPALALLDTDGVYGAPRFHKAAQQAGLKAIIGAELTIESARRSLNTTHRDTATPRTKFQDPQRRGASARRERQPIWRVRGLVASAEAYRDL